MDDFDYKKYSLQKLEDWVCDAISTAEATPQEVYDTIVSAITEYHDHHKKGFEHTTELLALLKGHRAQEWDAWEETYYPEEVEDDGMRPWGHSDLEYKGSTVTSKGRAEIEKELIQAKINANSSWNDGWTRKYYQERVEKLEKKLGIKEDKVVKWILPVEETKIAETDETEYFISFPDDLLEAANLKEGDQVLWIDQGDGSYLIKKVGENLTHQDMLDAGYWMTDDGFWMKKSPREVKSDEC
jgi:bifunctional DNA-binding transcriptional regulator/antitoxin component of YhaV-PrlF toxin-antitoxin module